MTGSFTLNKRNDESLIFASSEGGTTDEFYFKDVATKHACNIWNKVFDDNPVPRARF